MRAKPVLEEMNQSWTCPEGNEHTEISRYVGMIRSEVLSSLGDDFDEEEWTDATAGFQSYENTFPGADVWLDPDCEKIVGHCRDGLNIDWNGKPEVWGCGSCHRTWSSLVAADSCCLRNKEALHYAVEYGYYEGKQVEITLSIIKVEEDASKDVPAEEKVSVESVAKKTPGGLEPDLPMEEKYDFDAIAKKH